LKHCLISKSNRKRYSTVLQNDHLGFSEAQKKRLDRCIRSQGEFFKKMAAKIKLKKHLFFVLVREVSDFTYVIIGKVFILHC
jgi:hypothetical protein